MSHALLSCALQKGVGKNLSIWNTIVSFHFSYPAGQIFSDKYLFYHQESNQPTPWLKLHRESALERVWSKRWITSQFPFTVISVSTKTVQDVQFQRKPISLFLSRNYCREQTMSSSITEDHHLDYDALLKLNSTGNITIIDVREPDEIKQNGNLPGSINIPLMEVEKALGNLSERDFEERYKIHKPGKDAVIVFSCHSGRRSLQALQIALDHGYINSKNYKGGFLDWKQHSTK